jgi:hypothetical protein
VLVLAGQGSRIQDLVTHALMATVIQERDGLGGAMALVVASVADLVVASVVGGGGWELMGTPGGKFCGCFGK